MSAATWAAASGVEELIADDAGFDGGIPQSLAERVRIEAELLQEVVGADQTGFGETRVGFDQVATARVGIDGKEPALRDDDGGQRTRDRSRQRARQGAAGARRQPGAGGGIRMPQHQSAWREEQPEEEQAGA